MLVSKKPTWFGLYSTEKIVFISIAIPISVFVFYAIRSLQIPARILSFWRVLASKNLVVFFVISFLTGLPFIHQGVSVGEDISGQVKSCLQWIQGTVNAPNILVEPNKSDLSADQSTWSIRPPGAALLPLPGTFLGFSLGSSIQFGLIICSLSGGLGWLQVVKKFNIEKTVVLLVAILLGTKAGTSIAIYATANIILFALVPWFILLAWGIASHFSKTNFSIRSFCVFSLFLFSLGLFAWIKLAGIIVAGTIGACFFFIRMKNFRADKIKRMCLPMVLLAIIFWIPFFGLEKTNQFMTGMTANQFYGENDSDIQAPLFGKYWGNSTKGIWLAWSLAAAPGYALPCKYIAHDLKNFGLQFYHFLEWIDQNDMNEHVLLCGMLGVIFTILLLFDLKRCWQSIENFQKISLICFLLLPFIGLGILAAKYEWNYLLYNSHTFEFWYIYTIPTFLVCSYATKLRLNSIILLGVIVALPLGKRIELIFHKYANEEPKYISETENKLALKPGPYSEAIEFIEKDSNNPLDIVYFLPNGDTGDLILRTKMRTLATHFASGNFPNIPKLKTSKALNVYCVYDSSMMEDKKFIKSFYEKFPQEISQEIIFSGEITIMKIALSPSKQINEKS